MFNVATTVFAMPAGGGGSDPGSLLSGFFPLIFIFVIFWFLVIRPQQRKSKAHRKLVEALKKGDEVVTDGGIHGTIQKVTDNNVTMEIAPKVSIKIIRSRISDVVKEGKAAESKEKELPDTEKPDKEKSKKKK